jgi:hypothetical protein
MPRLPISIYWSGLPKGRQRASPGKEQGGALFRPLPPTTIRPRHVLPHNSRLPTMPQ